MPAIALTDDGTLSGAVPLLTEAAKGGRDQTDHFSEAGAGVGIRTMKPVAGGGPTCPVR